MDEFVHESCHVLSEAIYLRRVCARVLVDTFVGLFYTCAGLFYTCVCLFYTYFGLFYTCIGLFFVCIGLFEYLYVSLQKFESAFVMSHVTYSQQSHLFQVSSINVCISLYTHVGLFSTPAQFLLRGYLQAKSLWGSAPQHWGSAPQHWG